MAESDEPVFVTKNGYSHLVIMSAERYEREKFLQHVSDTIEISERQIAAGEVVDAEDSFCRWVKKHKSTPPDSTP